MTGPRGRLLQCYAVFTASLSGENVRGTTTLSAGRRSQTWTREGEPTGVACVLVNSPSPLRGSDSYALTADEATDLADGLRLMASICRRVNESDDALSDEARELRIDTQEQQDAAALVLLKRLNEAAERKSNGSGTD